MISLEKNEVNMTQSNSIHQLAWQAVGHSHVNQLLHGARWKHGLSADVVAHRKEGK
jgi:hypothetical protein